MIIAGLLTLIVCIVGGLMYLALTGFSKPSFAEIGRIAFAMGLLAFLIGAAGQSCSMSTGGGGGGAQLHH
jgi:hypothetical protein